MSSIVNTPSIILGFILYFFIYGCTQNTKSNNNNNPDIENFNLGPDLQIYPINFYKSDTCLYFGIEHLPTHKVGIWHKERGMIILPSYTSAHQLNNCEWLVMSKGSKKAIFDTLGNQVTQFENNFEIIASASKYNDLAVVHKDTFEFLIKPPSIEPINGEIYRDVCSFQENGYFALKSQDNHLYALGSPEGKRLTDYKYHLLGAIWNENSHHLSNLKRNLKKNRHLVAFASENQGRIYLDNKGEEVSWK